MVISPGARAIVYQEIPAGTALWNPFFKTIKKDLIITFSGNYFICSNTFNEVGKPTMWFLANTQLEMGNFMNRNTSSNNDFGDVKSVVITFIKLIFDITWGILIIGIV